MPETEDATDAEPLTVAEEDFGSSEEPSKESYKLENVEMERLRQEAVRFDKEFQIKILKWLIATIFVLLFFDFVTTEWGSNAQSHFQDIVTVIMPIFTFLLGMGTQAPANSKG